MEFHIGEALAEHQRGRDRVDHVDRQAQVRRAIGEHSLGALQHLVPGRAGTSQLLQRVDDDHEARPAQRARPLLHDRQLVTSVGEKTVEL